MTWVPHQQRCEGTWGHCSSEGPGGPPWRRSCFSHTASNSEHGAAWVTAPEHSSSHWHWPCALRGRCFLCWWLPWSKQLVGVYLHLLHFKGAGSLSKVRFHSAWWPHSCSPRQCCNYFYSVQIVCPSRSPAYCDYTWPTPFCRIFCRLTPLLPPQCLSKWDSHLLLLTQDLSQWHSYESLSESDTLSSWMASSSLTPMCAVPIPIPHTASILHHHDVIGVRVILDGTGGGLMSLNAGWSGQWLTANTVLHAPGLGPDSIAGPRLERWKTGPLLQLPCSEVVSCLSL